MNRLLPILTVLLSLAGILPVHAQIGAVSVDATNHLVSPGATPFYIANPPPAPPNAITFNLSTGVVNSVRDGGSGDQTITFQQPIVFSSSLSGTLKTSAIEPYSGGGFNLATYVDSKWNVFADIFQVGSALSPYFYADSNSVFSSLPIFATGGVTLGSVSHFSLLGTSAAGLVSPVTVTAGQSIRLNAAGTAFEAFVAGAGAAGVSSVNTRAGAVTLTKADVGLSNVPNVDTTNVANIPGAQPLDTDLTAISALATTTYGRHFLELANLAAASAYTGANNANNITNGTLDSARLSSSVVVTDGSNGIEDLGADVWSVSKSLQFYGFNGIYADGPEFIWNDGGVIFGYGGNQISGLTVNSGLNVEANANISGAVVVNGGAVVLLPDGHIYGDGSGLTNVPPPAGLALALDTAIYTGDVGNTGVPGSMDVGDGNGGFTQLLSGPNTLGPLDAGNLANVPLPAGLNLDNFTGGGVLCTGFYTSSGNGDSLQVGGTLIIDHPGTLAALDGSALTGYAINLIVGGAVDAAGAINPFDDFFHAYGLNLDTSLPGNGTASFANGNFYIDQGGNMVIAGNLQAAAALQTFGGIGVFGHGAPVTQPATPTTQAQMVAVLQAYGLCQ